MTTDKLGSRMNNNVCSVLNRTYNIRCTEGIVHDKRYVMAMCHFCHSRYQYDLNDLIAEYDAQAAQRAAEEAAQNTNA